MVAEEAGGCEMIFLRAGLGDLMGVKTDVDWPEESVQVIDGLC